MSTNYYAHIIPSKQRKKELYDAIEANVFHLIKQLTAEMYGRLKKSYDNDELIGGEVHLGKSSCGWKFLWNPNVYVIRNGHMEDANGTRRYIPDPDTPLYLYPLTKQGLHNFIFREDVLIYDEYGELQDKEEFWQMALSHGQEDGWDAAGYEQEYHEYIYPVTGELTDLLKAEGYQFTSRSNSDFYSDGLRFAGFTDFS
jgi:hypothetical protein